MAVGSYDKTFRLYDVSSFVLSPKEKEERAWAKTKESLKPVLSIEEKEGELFIGDAHWRKGSGGVLVPPLQREGLTLPTNLKLMNLILKDLSLRKNILLVGEEGSGKNTLLSNLHNLLNRQLILLPIHEQTEAQDLYVQRAVKKGETPGEESGLIQMMKQGGTIVLDKVNRAKPGVPAVLNDPLQFRRFHLPDGILLNADLDFRIVATMNPPLPPYTGKELSGELESRFSVYTIPYLPKEEELTLLTEYAPNLERSFLERLLQASLDLRAAYRGGELPRPFSTRALIHVVQHLNEYPKDTSTALEHAYNLRYLGEGYQELLTRVYKTHGLI